MKKPLKNLDNISKCPLCRKKYGKYDGTFLSSDIKQTVVHFTCAVCQSSVLFFISTDQHGVVSLGMLTDMDRKDVSKLFQKEAVSTDNVLEVHKFFQGI